MDSHRQALDGILTLISNFHRGDEVQRVHWPRSVRERIGVLIRSGMAIDDIAKEVPIPRATLFRWAKRMGLTVQGSRRRGRFIEMKRTETAVLSCSESREVRKSRDKSLTVRFLKSHAEVRGSVLELAHLLKLMNEVV